MIGTRTLAIVLSVMVAVASAAPQRVRARRQLADDDALQPIEEADSDEQTREKRKLEGITQAKFGIKNAVLGFVFGDGITSHRRTRSTDESPARVSLLPTRQNSPPTSSSITPSSSSKSAGTPVTSVTSGSAREAGSSAGTGRGARQTDDIPVFDRNKVTLDFPGRLFGPSLSLLIRTTKIVGDVIQNSAERYQSFLRLFRPLFRGQFEIKGLDPATTTTTTTTTTTAAPKAADNEVRRR